MSDNCLTNYWLTDIYTFPWLQLAQPLLSLKITSLKKTTHPLKVDIVEIESFQDHQTLPKWKLQYQSFQGQQTHY